MVAIARYSASAEERDTMVCFLAFQETNEWPKKIQKPVTERRVSEQVPQSASEKALSWREEEEEKKNP